MSEHSAGYGRRRPNEGLPLTHRENPEELNFYYSRERRLSKAPQNVKALYEEGPKKRKGLFGSLTATRPLRFMFFSVVLLALAAAFAGFFGTKGAPYLGGNRLEITVTPGGGESFVVIEKKRPEQSKLAAIFRKRRVYSGPVDVAAAPAGSGVVPVIRIFFSEAAEEEFRFAVPYNAPKIDMLLKGGRNTLRCTAGAVMLEQ